MSKGGNSDLCPLADRDLFCSPKCLIGRAIAKGDIESVADCAICDGMLIICLEIAVEQRAMAIRHQTTISLCRVNLPVGIDLVATESSRYGRGKHIRSSASCEIA